MQKQQRKPHKPKSIQAAAARNENLYIHQLMFRLAAKQTHWPDHGGFPTYREVLLHFSCCFSFYYDRRLIQYLCGHNAF